jgi:general secretion pathway protein J
MSSIGDNKGFTLVEMLVSLALLSLMAVYALNAFSSLQRINRVADRTAAQGEVQAVVRSMRETLSDARPFASARNNGEVPSLFRGQAEWVEFATASNGSKETGGIYLVRYSIDNGGQLVSERSVLHDGIASSINKVRLLSGVENVKFTYRDWNSDLSPKSLSIWEQADRLPHAVEIALTFPDGDPRVWPRLQVAVQAAR